MVTVAIKPYLPREGALRTAFIPSLGLEKVVPFEYVIGMQCQGAGFLALVFLY
jgi:hypothetical protein